MCRAAGPSLSILTSLSDALEWHFLFLGSKMLEGVPGMDATRRAILEHHEHFDGSGTLFDPEVAQFFTAAAPTH